MESPTNSYDLVWKVVLVGNSGVGKTNFLTRYAYNQFNHDSLTTIGIDFACKDVTYNDRKIKLQIWDTAGQERFRVLSHLYYSRAVAVIILYDITKHTSFQDVSERWLREIQETANINDPVLMLLGHKLDLDHLRMVTRKEGEEMANKNGMLFSEASAMDSRNIEESFDLLLAAIGRKQALKALEGSTEVGDSLPFVLKPETKKKKVKLKGCC